MPSEIYHVNLYMKTLNSRVVDALDRNFTEISMPSGDIQNI